MKKFSAQYAITNNTSLKRPIITTDDDGRIISVEDTSGKLIESHSIEFYNGIIIPGFVNCHCHLELSHMRAVVPRESGLPAFIDHIRSRRNISSEKVLLAAISADNAMFRNGISLCADICNTADTFGFKDSSISYHNLIEVFGIDPSRADKRLDEALMVADAASRVGLPYSIVPHSAYSVSLPLFRLIHEVTKNNTITSIHFMETPAEKDFIQKHSGTMLESYLKGGLLSGPPETPGSHEEAVINQITSSGNLILVHNTFVNREVIRNVKSRGNLFWCLCPNSNLYIEKTLPPVSLLMQESCEIVIGTDSLASNNSLDIMEELKTIQAGYPDIRFEELVMWATLNGARALCRDDEFGSIEAGKKPGLLLVEDVDLENMKVTNETSVRRLI